MSKYSKDKIAEISARVSRLMATNPNISGRKIAEQLKYNHHFILKLMNKITRARAEEIKRVTVEEDLADLNDFIKTVIPVVSGIIFDAGANDRDKISATRALVDAKLKMLNSKFDAGVFERQLGKLKTEDVLSEEEQDKIKNAIDYALKRRLPRDNGSGDSNEPIVEN